MKGLKNGGYTVVESVIAIIVIGIVAASIYSLFAGVQRIQRRAANLDSATRAAQLQVESLRNINYSSLNPGEHIDFSDDLPDTLPSPRSAIVEISEPASDLRRVDVRVVYTESGIEQEVRLSSLIGVLGITQ